jgi:hypothetical protein
MRTTINLPDPLFRQAKAAASLRGVSLKTYFTEALDRMLKEPDTNAQRMDSPPLRNGPKVEAMSNADLEKVLMEDELKKVEA